MHTLGVARTRSARQVEEPSRPEEPKSWPLRSASPTRAGASSDAALRRRSAWDGHDRQRRWRNRPGRGAEVVALAIRVPDEGWSEFRRGASQAISVGWTRSAAQVEEPSRPEEPKSWPLRSASPTRAGASSDATDPPIPAGGRRCPRRTSARCRMAISCARGEAKETTISVSRIEGCPWIGCVLKDCWLLNEQNDDQISRRDSV